MTDIAKALAALVDPNRDQHSNPVKGTLRSLALNYSLEHDGWQAIAQFWHIKKWSVATGADPAACVLHVLTHVPTDEPKPVFDDLLG